MNNTQAMSALNQIREDIRQQKADAERKNRIRKCDIHMHRISLCQQKIDALDFAISAIRMLEDDLK